MNLIFWGVVQDHLAGMPDKEFENAAQRFRSLWANEKKRRRGMAPNEGYLKQRREHQGLVFRAWFEPLEKAWKTFCRVTGAEPNQPEYSRANKRLARTIAEFKEHCPGYHVVRNGHKLTVQYPDGKEHEYVG